MVPGRVGTLQLMSGCKSNRSPVRTIGTVVSIALLLFLMYRHGWAEIARAARGMDCWRIALAFALVMMSRIATTARWQMVLRGLDVRIPFSRTLSLTFAGIFIGNFLPTTVGGDIARLAGVVNTKRDLPRCAASLVLDRVVGLLGMLVMAPFGLHALSTAGTGSRMGLFFPLLLPIAGSLKLLRVLGCIRKSTADVIGALAQVIRRPGCLLGAMVFTWLHMLCLFASITVLLAGMGQDVSLLLVAGLWSLVYLVALLPISINGYGVQELTATYIFTQAADVSPAAAVALAIFVRTLTLVATFPGVVCVPALLDAKTSSESRVQSAE